MMIQNLTIQDLVTNYFQVHQKELPGADDVDLTDYNKIINLTALAWLTDNCGKIYQDITDDENLNADLIDIFAQTFVRHFWSIPIGYDSPLTFFVYLRGFLDEELPLWAQFYKEAIINKGLYNTSVGTVTVEDNGTLHFDGTNLSDNTSNTTGKNSNNASTSSSANTASTTNQKTSNSNLTADADSPQDQLNLSIGANTEPTINVDSPQSQTNSNLTADFSQDLNSGSSTTNQTSSSSLTADSPQYQGNASGSYDFKYASKVNGGFNNSSTGTADNSSTSTNSINSTTGNNSTNQAGHNVAQDTHDQQTGNLNKQLLNQRTQALSDLALSVSYLANGVYQNMFLKMKHVGLFLLTY